MQWTPNGMAAVGTPLARPAAGIDADDDQDDDERPAARPLVAKPKAKTKPPTPKDIVRMARARRREIDIELRRMRRLEGERAQLTRLLDAADKKPAQATVREIKRSAG